VDRLLVRHGHGDVGGILKIFNTQNGALLRRIPPDERTDIFVSSAVRDADAVYVASERGFGAFRLH
jgi:hypothetical protein